MSSDVKRFLTVLRTRRGWGLLSAHFSIAFAALSGIVQLALAVRPVVGLQGSQTILAMIGLSIVWAIVRSIPRVSVSRDFTHPNFTVTVKEGDLFAEEADLVIGFTDVYDTSIEDGDIISPRSIQAQLLKNVYEGDVAALDVALETALHSSLIFQLESESDKPRGKRGRYPIGTVAVLSDASVKYYCVAYSRMSNDLVAKSSVDYLWRSLNNTWSAISVHSHSGFVAIPILGSDLARVDNLGRESLLKMIILSFVARSREGLVSRGLTVAIHPGDADQINMNEVRAFLNSL